MSIHSRGQYKYDANIKKGTDRKIQRSFGMYRSETAPFISRRGR